MRVLVPGRSWVRAASSAAGEGAAEGTAAPFDAAIPTAPDPQGIGPDPSRMS